MTTRILANSFEGSIIRSSNVTVSAHVPFITRKRIDFGMDIVASSVQYTTSWNKVERLGIALNVFLVEECPFAKMSV